MVKPAVKFSSSIVLLHHDGKNTENKTKRYGYVTVFLKWLVFMNLFSTTLVINIPFHMIDQVTSFFITSLRRFRSIL